MAGQALPDPVAAIAEAPDRADFVAALVVLDHAFADAVDIGRIVVEIADQVPHGFQGMVQHGAVIGCRHGALRNRSRLDDWAAYGYLFRVARSPPPDFRM